jgi:hypothetical protein
MNQPDRAHTKTPSHSSSKSHYHERIICSLMLLLGILGLQHIMTSSPKFSPTVYYTSSAQVSPMYPRTGEEKVSPVSNQEYRETDQELLQISGHFEAEEELIFNIPDFFSKVSYVLNLGNNHTIPFNDSTVHYRYPKSGRYTIELWATHLDEKKLLFSRKIKINERIEVDEDSFIDLED